MHYPGKAARRLGAASLAVLTCAVAPSAFAQQSPEAPEAPVQPPPVDSAATAGKPVAAVQYPASFFAQYNPVSAADMVSRVPGFELRDGEDRRGFGATAGNVLINGERPSSKTALSELLKRIPAASVLRIELISGSSAALDVRGESQFVNVVIKQGSRRESATSYVAGVRYIQYSNRVAPVLQLSRIFPLSQNSELSLDVQVPNLLGRGEYYDTLVNGQGVVTGSRFQVSKPNNWGLQGAAGLRWRPTPRDNVNLNLTYAPAWNESETLQTETSSAGALRSSLTGATDYENNYSLEAGADWEHRFSSTVSLKLIGLASNVSVDQHDRFDIFTAPASNVTRTQDRITRSGERIGRGQLKWNLSPAHTVELGAEGAFNFRDTQLDIFNQTGGGSPTPVPLPVADARVEEVRGEVFVADVWTVNPKLSIEAGFNYEVSRITQTGDQQQERQFQYPKPRFTATYAVNGKNTVRARLIRDVAQLDFAEFSSAVDFVNTTSIQGNPNLKPETAWKSRLEWETRFAARAALTLAVFADAVQDVHDLVVINGADAYGNIGDGRRYGVQLRASSPLDSLGLRNAELRFDGLYQHTEVTDPITGETRSFAAPTERQGTPAGSATLNAGNKDWAYVVNFRQNLPKISSSAGFAIIQWAERWEYRRVEMTKFWREKPRVDLYFETTAIKGVTIRGYVNNILPAEESRVRTFFIGDRSSGVVQKAELRRVLGGPEGSRVYGVQVSGKF